MLGECGLAAPLGEAGGELAGAIGLVVPSARVAARPGAVDALRTAARSVSRELGAPSWPPSSNSPGADWRDDQWSSERPDMQVHKEELVLRLVGRTTGHHSNWRRPKRDDS